MAEVVTKPGQPVAGGPAARAAAAVAELNAGPESNLISVLQDVQDRLGYLPEEALIEIGRRMKLPLSRIYGVVSFYAQFHTQPRGRHTVRCCNGTACHVRGTAEVLQALRKALGVREGQTTRDGEFTLETVACLGACFLAPVMMIDQEYYGRLTAERVHEILRNHRSEEPPPC